MSTRVIMIEAGPTPWDAERRFVGSRPLPLTAEAVVEIQLRLDALAPGSIDSVYRPACNEACDQVARMIAKKFNLRARDNPDLEAVRLGLWEGLKPDDVKFRFPTVLKEWEDHPLIATPPDGESLQEAIARIEDALRKILRRNREQGVALALRPMTMQIAIGILRRETPEIIAAHLHQTEPIATIELDLAEINAIIS